MQALDQQPLKVLMTADTVGGVWTYCMELCRALAPYNVQFFLVTAGAPMQQHQRDEVLNLHNVDVFETAYKLEWMDEVWADVDASGAHLLELEQALKPNLIHLNSYSYGSLPFAAPKIVVAHSDVFSWWEAVHGNHPQAAWNEYYRRVKRGLDSASQILAPSAAMLEVIKRIYNPVAPGKVVYNFRSAQNFTRGKKQPVVMAMGRIWDEAKNVQLLVQAARHIGYNIKLAGDKAFEQNTIDTTGSKVTYLGKLSAKEVAAELSTASVFVLPARYEPFGLSALEAALSGCALVLGNIPSLREIWEDAAVYVETDDATSMAVVVNKLMCDPEMCAALSEKAYSRALYFSGTQWGNTYLHTYREVIEKNKTTANSLT